MKTIRLWVWACCFFASAAMNAQVTQQVTAIQYYYNTDPGVGIVGNGGIINVTPAGDVSQSFTFSLPSTLSSGIHQLYVRCKDELGRWSATERRLFYISDIVSGTSNLVKYQYFFDNDPGFGVAGSGAVVDITSTAEVNDNIAIALPALSAGLHQLYIRVKDEQGRWSIAERRLFYVSELALGARNIETYQYYFDTDPGVGMVGNGALVPVTSTSDLNTTISIALPILSNGFHQLYIRAKDDLGRWSVIERRNFLISPVVEGLKNIVGYQYFIDTDPGVNVAGSGGIVAIPSSVDFNATIAIPLPALSKGVHQLYLRAKDEAGSWSIAERRMFYVTDVEDETHDLIALEYFIDTDPGVNNANSFPITASGDFNQLVDLRVPCLSTGTHYLYVRAKDSASRWSIIERDTFVITSGIAPSIVSPAGPLTICDGSSVILSTTPVSGVTYQWVESGVSIAGETEPSLTVTTSGSYALQTICGSFVLSNTVEVSVTPVNTYYADADGDGYGDPTDTFLDCTQPTGFVANDDDCDDSNTTIHPNAAESCNLVDDDCDSEVDEGVQTIFYADADNDGFGNSSVSQSACTAPTGYVANDDDCNDTNPLIHPDAIETCNETDDDCDGQVDDGVQTLFYADSDNDGYGNPDVTTLACSPPAGYVSDQTDCNDASSDIYPGAPELCNNIDDDCDNEIDEGFVISIAASSIATSNGDNFCAGGNTELNVVGGSLGTGAVWKWYESGCGSGLSIGTGNTISISPSAGMHTYFVRAEGTCNTTVCASLPITVYSVPSNDLCPASFSAIHDATLCSSSQSYAVSFSGNPAPALTYEFTGATSGSGAGSGSNSSFNVGETTVLVIADNLCGTAQCEFAITIDDVEDPVFVDCPETVSADVETGQWGAHVEWVEPQVIDNCEVALMTSSHQSGNFFVVGETTVTYTAIDVHGNSSTCSFNVVIAPPEVLGEVNISIFANDIQFSDPTPDPGNNITVYATIHNYSNVDAGPFTCRLYDMYAEEYYPDIVVPGLEADHSTLISWIVTTPMDPAFVPMKVSIDAYASLEESNELDNEAQRPYINGDPELGGSIVVMTNAVPQTSVAGLMISLCGSAYYDDTSVPLEDPSVAGAQVTISILETGQVLSGTTNSNGDFCIPYQTPNTAGLYHFSAEVTDFTLTGDANNTFTLTEPIINCPKDLSLTLQLSGTFLCGQPYHIAQGEFLTGSVRVYNGCDAVSAPTTLFISLPDGSPVPGPYTIPELLPGATYDVALPAMLFNTAGITFINATIDYYNVVAEANESNNSRSITIHVHPAVPDIVPVSGNITTTMECIPGYVSFVIRNVGGAPTGDFQASLEVYFESSLEETQTQVVQSIPGLCEKVITFPYDPDNAGTYSIHMDCDLPNEVTELSESNNSLIISKVIGACDRDLFIEGNCGQIIVSPADPSYPGMITIQATVVNGGELAVTTPFYVDFDVAGSIYSVAVSSSIPSKGSYNITTTVPTPAHGNNELLIHVDAGNDVSESNEGNNSISENICWDFTLTNTTCSGNSYMSATQRICEPSLFRIGLRNLGLYSATSLQSKFEISGPGLPAGWNHLGTISTFIGHTCECPVEVALPNPFLFPQVGTYTLRIIADPAYQYNECNEVNNEFQIELQVVESPDYAVYSQYIAPSDINPDLNETVTFNLTYKNEGCTGLNSSELMLLVDNTPLDSVIADGLASGTFNTYLIAQTWSSGLPGLHVARTIIDHDQIIAETDELNNEATRAIIVGDVPDFNITDLQVSDDSPQTGQTITIDVSILNEGESAADGTLRVFMVSDLNQEVLINETPIHLASQAAILQSCSYFISGPVIRVIARVINAVPAEYDFSDNERNLDLNSLTLVVLSADVTCEGQDLGYLEAQVSGGQAPYFVQWSNGHTGNQIDVASGTYSVTVTDANGVIDTSNDTIMDLALPVTWYEDADGDGYGNPDASDYTCTPPPGYVGTGTDCNDAFDTVYPGAWEIPDGLDNDCDGLIDEGLNTLDVDAGDCDVVLSGYDPTSCQTLSVSASGGVEPYSYLWNNGATTPTTEVCPEETTIYTVVVTDQNGFTAADNVTVQVIDISCGNNNDKVLVCHLPPGYPENIQMICIAPSAIQAHLDHGCYVGMCDAPDPCEGANQSMVIEHHESIDETIGNHLEKTVSVHRDAEDLFLLKPNPADDQIEIQTNLSPGVISVMDVSGKVVLQQVLSGHNNTVNTGSLINGIYYVRLENGAFCYIKSIVVMH